MRIKKYSTNNWDALAYNSSKVKFRVIKNPRVLEQEEMKACLQLKNNLSCIESNVRHVHPLGDICSNHLQEDLCSLQRLSATMVKTQNKRETIKPYIDHIQTLKKKEKLKRD
jgi:hypothetical protein